MEKRGNKLKIILPILIIVITAAIYFTFFYTTPCKNIKCWDDNLVACSRASYTNEGTDSIWNYKIKGKSGNDCIVTTKIVEIKKGLVITKILEGKTMICNIPLGTKPAPEANLNLCHGVLKEEMQNIVINNLYKYILENTGVINEDLLKPTGTSSVNTATTNMSVNNSS